MHNNYCHRVTAQLQSINIIILYLIFQSVYVRNPRMLLIHNFTHMWPPYFRIPKKEHKCRNADMFLAPHLHQTKG